MKMANTAVVIARCIASSSLANFARAIPSFRNDARSRRLLRHPDQRAKPLLQIWSQWVENWTVLTITVGVAVETGAIACDRRVAIGQHVLEKLTNGRLRHCATHIASKNEPLRMLGFSTRLRRSLWRRRHHEPAAICDSGAHVLRNGRSRGVDPWLAGWLRFGRHRERPRRANRGPRSISRRHR